MEKEMCVSNAVIEGKSHVMMNERNFHPQDQK
jgi:hypothetical protein